ncbi:hypothetical protein A9Q89_03230 [Gammaproteobacteria bacterium 53_120_T64]|nr:hypothetical protein A9Q89_03230 [Gammaproteobacteria bacterium 53_120_T64]
MNLTKLIAVVLLSTLFSISSYAKHPHPLNHQRATVSPHAEIYHHSVKRHAVKHRYSGYQSTHLYHQFHSESSYQYQFRHHLNYRSYPGYKRYRSGKPRSLDSQQHRDNDYRRGNYRLIAGALVLSEALHHVRH